MSIKPKHDALVAAATADPLDFDLSLHWEILYPGLVLLQHTRMAIRYVPTCACVFHVERLTENLEHVEKTLDGAHTLGDAQQIVFILLRQLQDMGLEP